MVVFRFEICRKLGQGTYGKVQLGINKETGQKVSGRIRYSTFKVVFNLTSDGEYFTLISDGGGGYYVNPTFRCESFFFA